MSGRRLRGLFSDIALQSPSWPREVRLEDSEKWKEESQECKVEGRSHRDFQRKFAKTGKGQSVSLDKPSREIVYTILECSVALFSRQREVNVARAILAIRRMARAELS
jgi:hypothetical protein